MIGMALIAMASVTASSLKESFRATLGSTLTADYLVTPPDGGEISQRLAGEIDALPRVRRGLRGPLRNGSHRR